MEESDTEGVAHGGPDIVGVRERRELGLQAGLWPRNQRFGVLTLSE